MLKPVDLLEVAKGINPDFAKNMPQEVADAFASGDVARIYRSSIDLPKAVNTPGSIPITGMGGAGKTVQPFGDYSGSIYVQTKDGRTARFKGSTFGSDTGWNANQGRGAFLDEAFAVDGKAYDNLEARYGGMTVPDRSSVHALRMGRTKSAMTFKEASVAAARDIGTPVGETSGKNLLGSDTVEFSKTEKGYKVHKGSTISDVFESTGERYYYDQPDSMGVTRGNVASEPIDDFMSRKGLPSATIASDNANKVIPLADEYDTGSTAAKVASGETISNPPPTAPSKAADVDLSKLSDEELAASKAKLEKELKDLDAEAKKTEQILAEARAGREQATSTKPKGPSSLGTPADIKTQPAPHGVAIAPPTVPPPAPPGPSAPPGPPTTSPTGPTAKIVNNTQNSNLTAREALRGIGEDIKAARKPGQRLLSADGSKAMSQAVTRGIKGSRNLKMLAVGSALGLGGYAANRVSNRDNPLDLEG
jgi:hypothetical protein